MIILTAIAPGEAESWAKLIERYGAPILFCIIFSIALFFMIRWIIGKVNKALEQIITDQATIINLLESQRDDVCEIKDDTKAMAVSLRIHTQQNKVITEKIKEIFDCLLKKLLKGNNQNDSSTAREIDQPGQ